MGILTHLVRIRKGSESGFSRLQITADSWKVPNSSPAKLEHKWLHVLHEAGDTGQQLRRLSADGHVEVEMCEPPRLSTYKWTAISPDPLITRILWLGVGRQSRPRKGAPENSDPWFPSINGVPRSVFDDWCPKGEGAKLLAGSKETGSYKKKVSTVHPFAPRHAPTSQDLRRGLSGSPATPKKISAHPDGRWQKAQNKPKERFGSKH